MLWKASFDAQVEATVTRTISGEKQAPHVMVQFCDGAHFFLLPAGATLLELADRVDDVASIYDSAPLAIHVEFATHNSRCSIMTRSHRVNH